MDSLDPLLTPNPQNLRGVFRLSGRVHFLGKTRKIANRTGQYDHAVPSHDILYRLEVYSNGTLAYGRWLVRDPRVDCTQCE